MKKILLLVFVSINIISCDPCADCGVVTFEPTVEMVFINADSISSIDSSLTVFNLIDSSLTANIDSLSILRDSLQIVNDSINAGGNLGILKNSLETLIVERRVDSSLYALESIGLDSIAQVLTRTKSSINTGLLLISEIQILESGTVLTYLDSATSWKLPLSFNNDFSRFQLTIDEELFTIELDYENFTEVDAERNVLIRAEDIQVINHSFDSLNACEDNCVDGNATFTFYF